MKKKIMLTVFLICVWYFFMKAGIWLHTKVNANPHLVVIQELLDEQLGEGFEVSLDYEKSEIIEGITILGDEDLYSEEDIFSRVDAAQKLIYSYIMEHKNAFNFTYTRYEGPGVLEWGFELNFQNTDTTYGSGHRYVFEFSSSEKWKGLESEGFHYLCVTGPLMYSGHYKLSDLLAFSDIKELCCSDIVIDDANLANKMTYLKGIDLEREIEGDVELFREKLEQLGIEVLPKKQQTAPFGVPKDKLNTEDEDE